MKKVKLLVLAVLSLFVTAVNAGTAPKEMVSENAQWVIYLDVKQLKTTELWKMATDKLKEKALERPEIQQHLDEFKDKFNLDPEKDLDSVLLYGEESKEENGVMIIQGNFDETRLVQLVNTKEGYAKSKIGNYTVHQWLDDEKKHRRRGKESVFCTFYDKGTAVVSGQKDTLKEALDVLDGNAPSLADSGAFANMNVNENAFFSVIADAEKINLGKGKSDISKKLKKGSLSVTEEDGKLVAKVVAVMKDAEAAKNVNIFAQGMIALVKMDKSSDPDLAEILKNIKIDCKGDSVTVDFEFAVAKLKEIIERKAAECKKASSGVSVDIGCNI